jgi:hypothetical protein
MRGLVQFAVVAVTVVTLMLGAAVGASAHSGTFGSSHGTTVSVLNNHFDFGFLREKSGGGEGSGDKHGDGCNENNDHHDHSTPGHKHHPCGNKGDDTD